MSNPAFDLASLAQSGEFVEDFPARSRRKSANPFTTTVQKVAEAGANWRGPVVSAIGENGEVSVGQQMENGIRHAGASLDRADREAGGPGWKTIIRKVVGDNGATVQISFRVERRPAATPVAVEAETADSGETTRRSRRNSG